MQHYFENGGGACYVYFYSGTAAATKESFDTLANFISAHPDITLIVLSASTTTNNLASSAVGDLMSQSTGHSAPLFCLVGGDAIDRALYFSSEAKQTAAYYPYLKTSYLQSFVPDLDRIKINSFNHYTWGTEAPAAFLSAPADSADGNLQYQYAEPNLNTDTSPMTELDWEIKMSNAEKALAELADSKNRVPVAGEPAFDQQQYDLKMSEAEKLLRELADSKPKSEDQLKEVFLHAEHEKEARLSAAQRLQAEIAVIGKIISDAANTAAHAKDAIAAAETLKKLQANAALAATSEPDTDPATGAKTAQQETAEPQKQLPDDQDDDQQGGYNMPQTPVVEPAGKLTFKIISTFKDLQAVLPNLASEILAAFKAEVASVVVSPVAAIAGAYCLTDAQRGVWKAPANVTLSGVTGLCDAGGKELIVTESVNANLLKNGINAIRYFPGKGFTVWGARTMVDDGDLPWRYIPVRRLFNIAERDIKEAMAKVVFEPNSPTTWEILRGSIDAYLHNLWKQGGLFGDKPQQAYFVKIGLGTTMSPTDINSGKMIVKVGMAAVKPAEFIILEFSQKQI
ncbi:phage tail sheath family protein [Rouxiella sp. WC2420]|uniref:Phage tail sheath family protein n=1 Tax=Rouxiella sp. WC2420 TaxID=3234145 RepID=A0AB39VY19_9GAMM